MPQLIYAAGKSSSDNASQIAAIENMVTAGVKGILITVADAKAENAAIAKARKAGVLVIALDSPTEPDDGRRRALRDEQLQRRRPDREVRPGRDEGQDRDDRDARRARRLVGRSAPAQRLPEGLRDQERQQADRLRRQRRRQHAPIADGDGELPPEEPEHRRRLHDQRAERGRRLDGAEERRQDAERRRRSCPSTAAAPASATSRPASSTRPRSSTRC